MSLRKNNPAQAFAYFNRAKTLDPLCFDAWFALGNLFSQMNNLDQSVFMLQKAAEITPDNHVVHGQLGVVLYRLQRLDEAISCYKKVIELQADNPAAYANLAMVYLDTGNRDEAVSCCLEAIKLKRDFTGAYILLASAYSSLALYEKALAGYSDALKLEPKNAVALAGKSDSLIKLGEKQQAYEVIREEAENGCNDPSILIAYASVSSIANCEEKASMLLENALKSPGITSKQKLQLHFSAGSLYDGMRLYDSAFQHYSDGNRLAQRTYDAEADMELFDNIIATFSEKNRQQFLSAQRQDLVPVFIVGMPRSGTSLVERILGSHSRIYPAGELGDIPKLAEQLCTMTTGNKGFPHCMYDVDEDTMNQLSQKHIKYLTEISGGGGIVTDKLPHNFLFLGLIELLFPGAKIIHCTRNSLDTCISNYFQYFSGPLAYPYKLKNIASHYNNYRRIMKHWEGVIQLPMLQVKYEDLIREQELVTRKIFTFLDLPMEKSCLEFHRSKHVTRTASFEQVREPVYTRSIGRWRHYEKHIGELINNLIS